MKTVKNPGKKVRAKTKSKEVKLAGNPFLLPLLPLPVILVMTWFLYRQALDFRFTNWDDPTYVLENSAMQKFGPETIRHFFLHSSASNYHPLTMISLAADRHAATHGDKQPLTPDGPEAGRFHLTNILLHLFNIVLVYLFILMLTERRWIPATVTALLFAIHPMHAESVAWIAERKDVLYTFFFMASLLTYLRYAKKPAGWSYFLAFFFFTGSLLSKPSAVILPLILWLIDFFVNRPFTRRVWLEKIPFLLASAAAGWTTLAIQSKIAMADIGAFSVADRLLFGTYGFMMYVVKMIVPIGLSAFYPYPNLTASGHLPLIFYLSPLFLVVIAAGVLYSMQKNRVILFGSLFFLFSLLLTLPYLTVGSAIIADRYTYVSSIGLFFIGGWYTDRNIQARQGWLSRIRWLVVVLLILYTGWMAGLATGQIAIWRNSETLWTDVIRKQPNAAVAYRNRGNYYGTLNMPDKALADYNIYLQLEKNDPRAYSNVGNIYALKNETSKALEAYSRSIQLDSLNPDTYLNRAITYSKVSQFDLALQDYQRSVVHGGDLSKICPNRAYTYYNMGRYREANDDFSRMIVQYPYYEDFYLKRGVGRYMLKDPAGALADYEKCLEINPANGTAAFNASIVFSDRGDFRRAYQMALKAQSLRYPVSGSFLEGLKSKQ